METVVRRRFQLARRVPTRPYPKRFIQDVLKHVGEVRGLRSALKRGIGYKRGKRVQKILLWEAEKYNVDLREILHVLRTKDPQQIEALETKLSKYLYLCRLLRRYQSIRRDEVEREAAEQRRRAGDRNGHT